MSQKHDNYEVLNLIGYGLAKFDKDLAKAFGFNSKSEFYDFLVVNGVANTANTVKNRQDLFDQFFDNGRKGWWQKGDAYIHRKLLIDSLLGTESVESYADVIKLYLKDNFQVANFEPVVKPITQSRYRQIQETGREAEEYFKSNYGLISLFERGSIQDARLFGDGYDFQVDFTDQSYSLVEVKGLKLEFGGIRFTEREVSQAEEQNDNYFLVVVSNLVESPQFSVTQNPLKSLKLKKQERSQKPVIEFLSESIKWQPWSNNNLSG